MTVVAALKADCVSTELCSLIFMILSFGVVELHLLHLAGVLYETQSRTLQIHIFPLHTHNLHFSHCSIKMSFLLLLLVSRCVTKNCISFTHMQKSRNKCKLFRRFLIFLFLYAGTAKKETEYVEIHNLFNNYLIVKPICS